MTSRALNQSISHNQGKAVSIHIPSFDLPLARDLNHVFSSDAIFICIILLLKCLRNEIFYFFLRESTKNLEDCCLPFLSILVLELKSFEDAKVKAKSMDTKDVILVMSHTLNKYSMDFKTTI